MQRLKLSLIHSQCSGMAFTSPYQSHCSGGAKDTPEGFAFCTSCKKPYGE